VWTDRSGGAASAGLGRGIVGGNGGRTRTRARACGASLLEFVFVAPALLTLGLGALQTGLIHHAKSTLDYATFEAARTGATHHARLEPMREELAMRLAPIMGGDGSAERAAAAIGRSRAALADPLSLTRIEIVNPTEQAFVDWGIESAESGKRVIPNSHLRLQTREPGASSSLSLQDANLLKIEVTHGLKLQVPIVGAVVTELLERADGENAAYYRRGELPIRSVATVRMQSEVWEESLVAAREAATGGEGAATPPAEPPPAEVPPAGSVAGNGAGESGSGPRADEHACAFGIDAASGLLQETSYAAGGSCGPDSGYDAPIGGGGPFADAGEPPPSSPIEAPEC